MVLVHDRPSVVNSNGGVTECIPPPLHEHVGTLGGDQRSDLIVIASSTSSGEDITINNYRSLSLMCARISDV